MNLCKVSKQNLEDLKILFANTKGKFLTEKIIFAVLTFSGKAQLHLLKLTI
ncbi:hypothetical protein FDUTEX481_09624 [Tolypothrix sp. PCC 7601]|nr:hypothetical protein FDUTEX481_09624 [Tolypothrix sp. PCC 7601]